MYSAYFREMKQNDPSLAVTSHAELNLRQAGKKKTILMCFLKTNGHMNARLFFMTIKLLLICFLLANCAVSKKNNFSKKVLSGSQWQLLSIEDSVNKVFFPDSPKFILNFKTLKTKKNYAFGKILIISNEKDPYSKFFCSINSSKYILNSIDSSSIKLHWVSFRFEQNFKKIDSRLWNMMFSTLNGDGKINLIDDSVKINIPAKKLILIAKKMAVRSKT